MKKHVKDNYLSVCEFRYEDFFGGKRTGQKKKSAQIGGSLYLNMDDELNNGNKNQVTYPL